MLSNANRHNDSKLAFLCGNEKFSHTKEENYFQPVVSFADVYILFSSCRKQGRNNYFKESVLMKKQTRKKQSKNNLGGQVTSLYFGVEIHMYTVY